jgi:hypothetical protein
MRGVDGESAKSKSMTAPPCSPYLRRETKNTLHKLRDILMIVLCEDLISPTILSNIISGDRQANGIGVAVSFIRGRGVFALFFYAVPRVHPGEARRSRPFAEAVPILF